MESSPASSLTRIENDKAVATEQGIEATQAGAARSAATQYDRLPAELLSEILQYVDAFTLWVTCRCVSKTWRAAAERLYSVSYLPKLKIDWKFEAYEQDPIEDKLKAWCVIELSTKGLVWVAKQDTSQARFKLGPVNKFSQSRPRGSKEDLLAFVDTKRWIDAEGRATEYLSDFFEYSDLGYTKRYEDTGREKTAPYIFTIVRQHVFFGGYMNDVTIPCMAVCPESGEIVLDWKNLFNDFFQEEAWVRRRWNECADDTGYPGAKTPREALESSAERRFGRVKRPLMWSDIDELTRDHCKYRTMPVTLYEDAYKRRIEMAHARVGQTVDLDAMHVMVHEKLEVFRQHRNMAIVKSWARRRGFKKGVSGLEETAEWSDCEP